MRLAGPMFAGAMLQNFQSLIDLFWVGKLGSDAVAALAMSGTILMLLFPVVMGAATGTVAMVSRFMGANRLDDASEAAGQSMLVAILMGVVAGLAGWLFSGDLCRILGADESVGKLAQDYLGISFIGCFTVFALFIGNSALQGAGNTVLPMFAMLSANIINIILDPVLFTVCWVRPGWACAARHGRRWFPRLLHRELLSFFCCGACPAFTFT